MTILLQSFSFFFQTQVGTLRVKPAMTTRPRCAAKAERSRPFPTVRRGELCSPAGCPNGYRHCGHYECRHCGPGSGPGWRPQSHLL